MGFVSGAATEIVEGPGFPWTMEGLGMQRAQDLALPGGSRSLWDWSEGLSYPAHPKWGPQLLWFEASSALCAEGQIPTAPRFPLCSLPKLGRAHFHPAQANTGVTPPNPTQGGVQASCPSLCHCTAPSPGGTSATSHPALPSRESRSCEHWGPPPRHPSVRGEGKGGKQGGP